MAARPSGRWRTRGDERMSLGAHLRELRKRLVISAIAIAIAAIGGFLLAEYVIDYLRVPIDAIAAKRHATLAYFNVSGSFDLRIKIALTLGIVAASPVWLYQLFAFLVPGLTSKEKRYTFGFFFTAVPLFFIGGAFGLYLFPHMVELLTSFSSAKDAITLDALVYYDFVAKLVLAVGVAFVLPVFLVLLNVVGVLPAATIIRSWRIAILLICLFTAIATPAADIVSMFLLAIPMVVLYFAACAVAYAHDRQLARRADELEASIP